MNSWPMHLKHNLLTVAYNVNGLTSSYVELIEFGVQHKLDVLLVGGTHLNRNKWFQLPNYVFYWNDRLGQTGGHIAIMVRVSILS